MAIGALTIVSLNSYLVRQLDEQLAVATGRSETALNSDGDDRRPGRSAPPRQAGGLVAPGQASGTLAVISVGGRVMRAVVLDDNGRPEAISNSSVSELAELDGSDDYETVKLGDDLGEYRVVANPTRDGAVLVTGLPMEPLRETLRQATLIVVLISIAGLLAAAAAGAFIISVALRPLRRVAATATSVADLPLDTGDVALAVRVPAEDTDPHTEVGQVGAALNHLLSNVADALRARHESEMRVRNFVADASHELRTPLASIRGYSELTRRADVDLPPDIVHALGRIESESIRMTSLVEDLLLLARLDAGRPIEFEEVDLSALLVAAVSDAHVAAPNHQWELDLPENPVCVRGDGDRLAQVVANLLANARVHTPDGTRIRISLSVAADGMAVLGVQDNGPGIPAQLVPEVFGRFSRADSSRSRAAGSTGLGLAIAAAVIGAHGGSIQVTSRPGETAFTVRLPV
ncbi:MAG: HAMP domain-containing protein [Actinobacteria bacterium]|nr:HAMP domain-containing protein [Actinomycetota bacterium]